MVYLTLSVPGYLRESNNRGGGGVTPPPPCCRTVFKHPCVVVLRATAQLCNINSLYLLAILLNITYNLMFKNNMQPLLSSSQQVSRVHTI